MKSPATSTLSHQLLTMIAKHIILPSMMELRNVTIVSSMLPMYVSNTRTDIADPWGGGGGGGGRGYTSERNNARQIYVLLMKIHTSFMEGLNAPPRYYNSTMHAAHSGLVQYSNMDPTLLLVLHLGMNLQHEEMEERERERERTDRDR